MKTVRMAALCVLSSFALLLTHAYRIYGTDVSLVDDAFIFFRYARHWAQGYGLVWNIGEPPVEGISSLLYTALLALGIRAGLDVVLWATVLNVALGLGVLALTLALARTLGIPPLYACVAPLLVAATTDVAFWAGGGMDVLLFTALLLLALWLTLNERHLAAGVAFSLLAMARLDALPLFLFAALFLIWRQYRSIHLRRPPTPPVVPQLPLFRFVIAFLVFFLPFYLARWAYFGWPLPNTYYAKMGGGIAAWVEGMRYVADFLRRPEVVALVVLATLGVAVSLFEEKQFPGEKGAAGAAFSEKVTFTALVAMLLLARAVAAGGDWMPHFRLMVPLWPFLNVLAVAGLWALVEKGLCRPAARAVPTVWKTALTAMLACVLALLVASSSLSFIARRPWRLWRPLRLVEPMHASQYTMGLALRDLLCPDDSVALLAAGAAAYLNDEHVIIDMLGLSDVHIAHSPPILYKGQWDSGHTRLDVDYILSRKPEWIQLDTHLFAEPEFRLREWMPPQVVWGDKRVREQYEFFPLHVQVPTGLPRPREGYIFFLHRKGAPVCGEM